MPGRVLIVDDSRTIRLLVSTHLRAQGYTIQEAVDGLDGLAVARSAEFDAVITDIDMPRLDGFGFLRALRETHPDLPAIVLTAHREVEKVIEAIRGGVLFDYLTKPVESSVLAMAVQRAVEVYQLRSKAREADQVRAMQELAVTAADRILNPLNTVALCIHLLRGGTSPEIISRVIASLEDVTARISAVIEQMSGILHYTPQRIVGSLHQIDLERATRPDPSAE